MSESAVALATLFVVSMTGLGLVLFLGVHSVSIVAPAWRDAQVAQHERAFKGVYALVSIIGFSELAKAGTEISNATFKPFLVYGLVALIYFALCYPLTHYARTLQRTLYGSR